MKENRDIPTDHQHKHADWASTPLGKVQMESVLNRVTYKPGWQFEIVGPYYSACSSYSIHATSDEPDARAAGKTRLIHRNYLLPSHVVTEALFIAHLRRAIDTWERHEAHEFLRLDGDLVDDPHACPDCLAGNEGHHV